MTSPTPGSAQLSAALTSAIYGSDPYAAFQAAMDAAAADETPPTNIDVEIYDNFWRRQGYSGDYINVKASFPRLKLPAAQLGVKGHDKLATIVLDCWQTLVPVTIQVESLRWAGWIEVAEDNLNADGSETIDCQIVGLLTMLDRVVVWPEPLLPIEIQPSEAIYIGNGITCLKTMVAEQNFRLQSNWMETVNTIGSLDLDWRTWFDSWNLPDQQWVTTPICVPVWDPAEDTSVDIAMHGRMDTCWKLMQPQLEDNGWYASLDVWLPGDPQPDGVLFPLEVATYIFNVRDYSGVTGPAANWTDGLAKDIVDLDGAILGSVLNPVLNPDNEYVPPGSNIEIAPIWGINYTPPWVIFNGDAQQPGLISMKIAMHAPQASRLVLGGRSPQWLNDALNATMEWAIDMLLIVVGLTGIPDTLLDGILDNTFLAFQLVVAYEQMKKMGPYGPPEKFFPTQSTYDIDILFAIINALWAVRGYPAAQFSFLNGLPYRVGRDLFPGAQASVIRRGVLYTDYLDDLVIEDSVDARAKVTVQVGDGRREEAPGAIFQRKLVDLEEDVNLILLAPPS